MVYEKLYRSIKKKNEVMLVGIPENTFQQKAFSKTSTQF